jgi:ABC-type transport system involved in multi-copper enzyme maturation permease subunit
MKGFIDALKAELIKIKHSRIILITFLVFTIPPLMGGVFMLIIRDPEALAKAGALAMKVRAMNFTSNWASYLDVLVQAMGVGGLLLFGFVASWIFGREYSEGTAKDLLSLPVTRTEIVHAKFAVYFLWCIGLALGNLLVGFGIGSILSLSEFNLEIISGILVQYMKTTLLTLALGTPIAFFAFWGKGYLAPLGFVSVCIVFAQIVAATGYGHYFPWAIPGLYSGAGGELKNSLNIFSYLILLMITVAGYIFTIAWWKFADQTK